MVTHCLIIGQPLSIVIGKQSRIDAHLVYMLLLQLLYFVACLLDWLFNTYGTREITKTMAMRTTSGEFTRATESL